MWTIAEKYDFPFEELRDTDEPVAADEEEEEEEEEEEGDGGKEGENS